MIVVSGDSGGDGGGGGDYVRVVLKVQIGEEGHLEDGKIG